MSTQFAPGTSLSYYVIDSRIGEGGMGEVYLAHDTRLGRKVAIKFLNQEFARDADKLERFVQEAKAASALNHPNILTVYEIGEIDGKHYIATEFIEGKTLRDHILPKQPMALDDVLKVTLQVAEALAAAHRAGIVHRDIKPENIMLRGDGYAKVVDFGLAKLAEPINTLGEKSAAQIKTLPGTILGTIAYMSPEQASGKVLDARSDIFSLGTVLYEMLTCRQPFTGETSIHALVAIIEKQPLPITTNDVEVPDDLVHITMRLLEKDISTRYQTADKLADDLREFIRRRDFEHQLRLSGSLSTSENITRMFSADNLFPSEASNTIAVMPFVNVGGSDESDYFSDGLAEELLNVLAKINGLRVAARTSAFSFKGKQTTITEIGHTLNVASVLDGSVRTSGNRVRISVRLTKVADGYNLWSQTYDREMNDIFAVQDDIAQSVVEELRAMLVGEDFDDRVSARVISEVARAVKGRAADPEAQRLMLLGRHFLDRTTREDTTKAIKYFREALDLDPGFALCWAELGRAFSVEAGKVWEPIDTGYANARAAIHRSLALEPDLAEAHAQLGRIQSAYDMDMAAARASYQRALELAPGNPIVVDGASILEFKFGNLDEALKMSRQVLSQDPLSAGIWHNLGLICHAADLFTEAGEAFRRALELGQQRFVTAAMLSLVLLDQGHQEKALEVADREPDEFWSLWAKTMILHRIGQFDEAQTAFDDLMKLYSEGDSYQIAEVLAVRGEIDAALEWLDRALDEKDPGITHGKTSPRLRSLHKDARWPSFLAKIGFNEKIA